MERKQYTAPVAHQVMILTEQLLGLTSGTGRPTDNGDGTISYDGPGGSFGGDDEIASRRGSTFWDDEDEW